MWPYIDQSIYIFDESLGHLFAPCNGPPPHCTTATSFLIPRGQNINKIVFPWVHVHIVHMVFWSTNTITWSGNPKGLSDDQLDIRVAILWGMPLVESPRDTPGILISNTHKIGNIRSPNKTPTEAQVMTSLTSGLPYLWTCSLYSPQRASMYCWWAWQHLLEYQSKFWNAS